ncbi:hypothetical protein J4E90_004224 [Alternaria incomplexa]|uniref:uncharacterized protein n=1 Tax=Alternaria incomplexa TaxID=1187928 RepID=UPI0022204128|nr:uncharacterized protein J4E90_004224 [Alternaria incomplexa]KAI4915778.1 hypothetical protein J4E90_004224 [Alternaria incomplexa]
MAASASYATPQHTSSAQPAPANPGNHATLHKDGYPSLAFFFSRNSRYLHLRKFSALAIRVLLYRQYKLTRLEKDLLHLEQRDAEKNPNILKDFALIEAESRSSGVPPEATQCWLYEELQNELKEYEEALLRLNRLAGKGYDVADLRNLQVLFDQTRGPPGALLGLDGAVWGSTNDQEGHAFDIYQIIDQPSLSKIGRFFWDKFALWAPYIPTWLWMALTWSRPPPDGYVYEAFSMRRFEAVVELSGNILASLLIYVAVTSLYLTAERASSVVGVIVIAVIITACSLLFRNQKFISMLST